MESKNYDLVCIGGGGAAIMAAVYAAAAGKKVALITKEPPGFGNTRMAAGMTACPGVMPEDSNDDFRADLLRSGEGLSEDVLVEALTMEASHGVAALEEMGPIFRRETNGGFSARTVYRLGGHSRHRSLVNLGGGPALGAALKTALWRFGIAIFSNTAAIDLVGVKGKVSGVLAINLETRSFLSFHCDTVLLATGGCGGLYYPHTTNNRGAVGDGLTLALNAGATLWDMEQIQAIPFGLTQPRSMAGALCGEPSTAGPAGRLLDAGGLVLLEKDINKMTRAAVTRVMMDAINAGKATSGNELYLDLGPNLLLPDGEKIYLNLRNSGIFNIIRKAYGKDAFEWKEPWTVSPTMHYQMGGIRVDKHGETGVPGLLAVGEVQAGLHGGNRLGSVALCEIFTFGALRGKEIGVKTTDSVSWSEWAGELTAIIGEKAALWKEKLDGSGQFQPAQLRCLLENCMWRLVGPVRDETALLQGLKELEEIAAKSGSLLLDSERFLNRQLRDAVELYLMLPAARAVILSALERRESRGAHLRSDYTESNDHQYLCHTYVHMNEDKNLESGLMPLGV